jgi:UPF0755 protein
MRKRAELTVFLILTALTLAVTHAYVGLCVPPSREGGKLTINVPRGASFRVVADGLEKAGAVRSSGSLVFAARLLGAYKKIQAGEYEFDRSMSPLDVLDHLVKGRVRRHQLTIPEGYNLREVAATLMEAGLADEAEFVRKATDARLAASLGLEGATSEGYLFPDTYEFTKGMSAEDLIVRMVERFKSVYYPDLDRAAEVRGLSMKDVVTLASIIEKETGAPWERRLISAVFHNRLKKGIRLQSDPTVIYGIEGFGGNLKRTHLRMRSPYNTYVFRGLPPGPIANPGRDALKAALEPVESDYLYFVSKNDGTHHFSRSLKEHNEAVDRFQRQTRPL